MDIKNMSKNELEEHFKKIEREEAMQEKVKHIVEDCNGSEREIAKALHAVLIKEHRTIQASFIRMMRTVIFEYANNNNGTDLRNEGAVNWCKEVSKTGGAIPYI